MRRAKAGDCKKTGDRHLTDISGSDNADVAMASVTGSTLAISAVAEGSAMVRVTATSGNLTAFHDVRVTVGRGSQMPDLIVELPWLSDNSLSAGARFTLSAFVRNRGLGDAASSTRLRFYRSADATIDASDAEVGTRRVRRLGASATSEGWIHLTAPTNPGIHYYGACVDPLSDESDISNNCSSAVAVTAGSANQALEPGDRVTVTREALSGMRWPGS